MSDSSKAGKKPDMVTPRANQAEDDVPEEQVDTSEAGDGEDTEESAHARRSRAK